MFDAQRFSLGAERGKSSLATTVRDFEVTETLSPSTDEIGLAQFDLVVTFCFSVPVVAGSLTLVSWFVQPLSWAVFLVLWVVFVPVVAFLRWDAQLAWLKDRQLSQFGSISWEKHEVSQVSHSAGKTKLVFRDYQALAEGRPQPVEVDERFSTPMLFSFPPETVEAAFRLMAENEFAISKRLLKKVSGVNDENYGQLVDELARVGFVRPKGQGVRSGFAVTEKGKASMRGYLLPSPTE